MTTPELQPSTNPEDAKSVAAFLRELSDAELSQGIAAPQAFVDRLPGFTIHHLRTADATAVVQLAKDEQQRRWNTETDRRSRTANWLAAASLVVAVLALMIAVKPLLAP